jgi:protein-L-isoaspartate(D-aspartate) O-methyltransferase
MTLEARKIRLVMELRQAGIADTGVLSAVERIPREAFVPETFQDRAYEDTALPIGHGQTLSRPRVVARMTEALGAGPRTKVLEIGTGSGYQAAVLSRICRRVYTIERYRPLLLEAEARFTALRLSNITARVGDGFNQLAEGGVMVLPVGRQGRDQNLLRLVRSPDGLVEEPLGDVRFVPLLGGLPDDPRSRPVEPSIGTAIGAAVKSPA